jgi:hypothetical protein
MSSPDGAPGFCRYSLRLERHEEPGPSYPSARDEPGLAAFLSRLLATEPLEVLGLLFLDRFGQGIGHSLPFRGSISRTNWEAPPIFALALLTHCRGFVLFHNHPSGQPEPSREDLHMTRRLVLAAHVLQIDLRDHLIFAGPGRYLSLRRRHPRLFQVPDAEPERRDGRGTVSPKYGDPDEPANTWSGRGHPPRWLRAKLDAGAQLDAFRIP